MYEVYSWLKVSVIKHVFCNRVMKSPASPVLKMERESDPEMRRELSSASYSDRATRYVS